MFSKIDKNSVRKARHHRQRRNLNGTCERPRLNVRRTNSHIYAQIINDVEGRTLCAASTIDPAFKATGKIGSNKDAAELVGKLIGERALEKGITEVTFDRGGHLYHGRVKALADGARAAGLKF